MENRNEIREFLASRRARITPEQAGLPAYGANRRVPGLRREEAALLAGVIETTTDPIFAARMAMNLLLVVVAGLIGLLTALLLVLAVIVVREGDARSSRLLPHRQI